MPLESMRIKNFLQQFMNIRFDCVQPFVQTTATTTTAATNGKREKREKRKESQNKNDADMEKETEPENRKEKHLASNKIYLMLLWTGSMKTGTHTHTTADPHSHGQWFILSIASAVPNVHGKCLCIRWLCGRKVCGVKLYLQMEMIYASLNLTEWAVALNYLPKPLVWQSVSQPT